MYDKLAGMTGTAATEADEFSQIYELETVVDIPTNVPMVRDDVNDLIYKTEEAKFDAVVEDIIALPRAGTAGAGRHRLHREVASASRHAQAARAYATRC